MNILILGSEGFIGSHFCLKVQRNSKYKLIRASKKKKVSFMHLNLLNNLNTVNLKKIKIDCIIDFGWVGVFGKYRNSDIQKKNLIYTKNLIFLAKYYNIKKLISFGSQAEYGIKKKSPTEGSSTEPKTLYGKMKLKKLNLLNSFCKESNINFIWLRIFSSYGIRERYDWLIPYLIKRILAKKTISITAGNQICDYIYIDDLVSAIILCLKSKKMSGIYNLGSGRGIKVNLILKTILELVNIKKYEKIKKKKYRKIYPQKLVANINKIKKLGWFPKVTLKEGLKQVIKYQKKLI
jgi:nucleoside-diphosphate-sugar epimerase